jgi:hypothetical protein
LFKDKQSQNVGFLPKKRRGVKTQKTLYNIMTVAEAFNHKMSFDMIKKMYQPKIK